MELQGKLSRKLGLRPTVAELQPQRILALIEYVESLIPQPGPPGTQALGQEDLQIGQQEVQN